MRFVIAALYVMWLYGLAQHLVGGSLTAEMARTGIKAAVVPIVADMILRRFL